MLKSINFKFSFFGIKLRRCVHCYNISISFSVLGTPRAPLCSVFNVCVRRHLFFFLHFLFYLLFFVFWRGFFFFFLFSIHFLVWVPIWLEKRIQYFFHILFGNIFHSEFVICSVLCVFPLGWICLFFTFTFSFASNDCYATENNIKWNEKEKQNENTRQIQRRKLECQSKKKKKN